MTTTRELISSTLRLINVLGAGQVMTADDATDSLATLNQMISTWSADGAVIYSNSTDTKTLTGATSYTMGVGGDINTTRPVSISSATYTSGSTIYPLQIYTSSAISQLASVSETGIPEHLYVDNGNPLLTLKLYPIPSSGTLTVYSKKPLSALAINDTLALPSGYEETLRYNLAVRLAPEYEKSISQEIKDVAFDGLKTIKRNNKQYSPPLMKVDEGLTNYNTGDIYRGYR